MITRYRVPNSQKKVADIPASNPSSVVISDRASLAQNFSENAKNVLCQASFGAGAYAIGGRLLGFPPLTVPAALVTAGALVAGLTLCPSGASQPDIFGEQPGFTGGQCPVFYRTTATLTLSGSAPVVENRAGFGPLKVIKTPNPASPTFVSWQLKDASGNTLSSFNYRPSLGDTIGLSVRRDDGLPDNCGDQPPSGGQVITNNVSGDTINSSSVVNNSNNNYVVPVLVNLGGINNSLNLSFGDINIGSLFPLNFDINISGTRFRFSEKPDGTLEPQPIFPDPDSPDGQTELLRKISKTLGDIQACVCDSNPAIETEIASIPVAARVADNCDQEVVVLEVVKGQLTPQKAEKFNANFALALAGCEVGNPPVQLEETLIYAATTLFDGRELFSGPINPEVHSLKVKITSINNENIPVIKTYPGAEQRKFGSVSFVTQNVSGGGDFLYVFDTETYYPLPRRGKPGRLRVLMRAGLSFEVYDTGERVNA